LRLVRLLDRALGALAKVLPCLGRGEPARRSEQQANADALFKLSDSLGDRPLSDAEPSRGARVRAAFDHADEYLHRTDPWSFLEGMPVIARSGLRDRQDLTI